MPATIARSMAVLMNAVRGGFTYKLGRTPERRCIASSSGKATVICAKACMDVQCAARIFVTANGTYFGGKAMGMRVCRPAGHPMPEIAGFVADLKAAFGEHRRSMRPSAVPRQASQRSTRAKMVTPRAPLGRPQRMSGALTTPCATVTIAMAAKARALIRQHAA